MSPLDDAGRLDHLRAEVAAFHTCLDGDLGAPVAACPGWDVASLATHLGRVHRWATSALGSDDEPAFAPRPRTVSLAGWYADGAAALVGELAAPDPAQPCWTLWPPAVVGFWGRRQVLETLVHRWDAQTALGRSAAVDADLVADLLLLLWKRRTLGDVLSAGAVLTGPQATAETVLAAALIP